LTEQWGTLKILVSQIDQNDSHAGILSQSDILDFLQKIVQESLTDEKVDQIDQKIALDIDNLHEIKQELQKESLMEDISRQVADDKHRVNVLAGG